MHRKQMTKIMNYEEFAAHLCGKFREEDCEEVFHQQPYQPVYSDQIENEIEKFCKFIKDGIKKVEKGEMHPVELAALAKYYFVSKNKIFNIRILAFLWQYIFVFWLTRKYICQKLDF